MLFLTFLSGILHHIPDTHLHIHVTDRYPFLFLILYPCIIESWLLHDTHQRQMQLTLGLLTINF
jgi:hypothetical protein